MEAQTTILEGKSPDPKAIHAQVGRAQVQIGRGNLANVAHAIHQSLRDAERLALLRGFQTRASRKEFDSGELTTLEVSPKTVADMLSNAQVDLMSGELCGFALKMQYALAVLRLLAERKKQPLKEPTR